jgi:hypothetical protein
MEIEASETIKGKKRPVNNCENLVLGSIECYYGRYQESTLLLWMGTNRFLFGTGSMTYSTKVMLCYRGTGIWGNTGNPRKQ